MHYFKIWFCLLLNRYMIKILKIEFNFYEAHLLWIVYPVKAIDIFFIRIK